MHGFKEAMLEEALCENRTLFPRVSNGSTLFSRTFLGTKPQRHHLGASSGEEYETDLFEVDIKPEIYVQTVYSTSQNPKGAALRR